MQRNKLNNKDNQGIISKTLDWAYSKAVVGFTGVDSAYDLGNSYLLQNGTLEQQVDSLIKWQVAKAASSGFVTGLGGVMVMPLTVPANIASVIYVQIRMITAIAYMGGHDIKDDRVKSLVYICMVGNGAKELLKDLSIKASEKMLSKILEKVSAKLAAKAGTKGIASAGKAIPILGGVVGGSYDAVSTKIVGKVAKRIFIDKPEVIESEEDDKSKE
ncbi:EcsC family protein [Dysgonomonas sp. Marseille-P4677]|uniref:EcsC family protein n=1 Tax=Dysgonomonas sp. Marseille-P4677 TaxID=2364790 RepID=UPI00191320C1|nr:EcsC family protein [Dysgonomonas sp. Marseille-P4677]MBK5723094.1 EcsC family protein [Dysgonomonas sp. Marseille-P4677]